MNVQQESCPYSLPVTVATVTKVISKMAMSIKLKVFSLISDTTRVQSSRDFFRQIFINRRQLLYLIGEQSVQNTKVVEEKLIGSKTFRWHTAHFSITLSYPNHTWKHATHSRHTFVQQSGSLLHYMMWRTTSCPVLFRSHSACFPRMWLWVLKIHRCEFGYRMRLSRPLITVLCVNVLCNRIKDSSTGLTTVFCCCVNVAYMYWNAESEIRERKSLTALDCVALLRISVHLIHTERGMHCFIFTFGYSNIFHRYRGHENVLG